MARYNSYFKGRLKSYLTKRLGMFDYRHGWMKGNCPSCGKEFKFGVNISLNRTNCFVCGYNPSPLDMVMDLEHLSLKDLYIFLDRAEFEGYEFKEEKVELKERIEVFLPEGYKLLNQGESQLAKSARSYISERGFDIRKMSRKGWGYCNKDKYFGYIILPFYDNNRLTYFNARNYMSTGPKYNNPDTDVTGVGKSMIWYNKDALYMYSQVYILEGLFNAETMGDKALAAGGKFVSRYQINDIIKSPVERVIIILDPDAIDKAVDLALKLVDFKRVKVVILPEGEDANSLGKTKTMRHVYKVRYQNRKELLQLKNSL